MTEDNQNIDLHHTAKMAVVSRVCGDHLSDEKPFIPLSELTHGEFVCSGVDHMKQRLNYMTLVGRIITSNLDCLEDFSSEVIKHIPHDYSKEMSQKSENVIVFVHCFSLVMLIRNDVLNIIILVT